MSAACRRDAWSRVFLKQSSSVSWSRRGSGGEECLSWPGDLCLAQETPSCLVYKAWGKDGRDVLGPVLSCDLLTSDTTLVLCLDRLQSGLAPLRPVHGALCK